MLLCITQDLQVLSLVSQCRVFDSRFIGVFKSLNFSVESIDVMPNNVKELSLQIDRKTGILG